MHCLSFTALFVYSSHGDHRDLHSFPTRRSSDLPGDRHRLLDGIENLLRDPDGILGLPQFGEDHRELVAAEAGRSEEHTSELQSRVDLVCRLLLEKKKELPRVAVSSSCSDALRRE